MNPPNQMPLKVLQELTLRAVIEDMNARQAVAFAIMPRFGLEITVANQELQVQVAELATGHDIRLARDVASGMIEALTRLVAKIDEAYKLDPGQHQAQVRETDPS